MAYIHPDVLKEAIAELNSYHQSSFLFLVFSRQFADGIESNLRGDVPSVRKVFDDLFPASRVNINNSNQHIQLCFNKHDYNSVKIRPSKDYGGAYQRTISEIFTKNNILDKNQDNTYKLNYNFDKNAVAYLGDTRIDMYPLLIFLNWNNFDKNQAIQQTWNDFASEFSLLTSPFESVFHCTRITDVVDTVDEPYQFKDEVHILTGGGSNNSHPDASEASYSDSSEGLIYSHAKIIYGAPGTGKSWLVQQQAEPFGKRMARVTFYPDYSFAQFVGGYKPVSQYYDEATQTYHATNPRAEDGTTHRRPVIDYVAVPGPLLTLLAQAYRHPTQDYLLIIEELNRSNAAAVFGGPVPTARPRRQRREQLRGPRCRRSWLTGCAAGAWQLRESW